MVGGGAHVLRACRSISDHPAIRRSDTLGSVRAPWCINDRVVALLLEFPPCLALLLSPLHTSWSLFRYSFLEFFIQ